MVAQQATGSTRRLVERRRWWQTRMRLREGEASIRRKDEKRVEYKGKG
jgi:hypothetical protein